MKINKLIAELERNPDLKKYGKDNFAKKPKKGATT
jgi:hypothetical protein